MARQVMTDVVRSLTLIFDKVAEGSRKLIYGGVVLTR